MHPIIAPLLQIGTEVFREAAIGYVRHRILTTPLTTFPSPEGTDSPPIHRGCPFCHVAGQLSIANLYLSRGSKGSPRYARIYQRMAGNTLQEAAAYASQINSDRPQTAQLNGMIHEVDIMLMQPLTQEAMGVVADKLSMTCHIALDIAEWYNTEKGPTPAAPRQIESDVVEGEVKVISVERGPENAQAKNKERPGSSNPA